MDALRDFVKTNGYAATARRMGCGYTTIQAWILKGRIPAERALEVEAKLGIPRQLLRPDLWPPDSAPMIPPTNQAINGALQAAGILSRSPTVNAGPAD